MTRQQQREYATYVQLCGEFNEQPQLLEAQFILDGEAAKDGYKHYRKECRANNIEPTLADFMLSVEEWYASARDMREKGIPFAIWYDDPTPRRKAKAATAGGR